jgi:hypothetical protein
LSESFTAASIHVDARTSAKIRVRESTGFSWLSGRRPPPTGYRVAEPDARSGTWSRAVVPVPGERYKRKVDGDGGA